MAVVYPNSVKEARLDAVRTLAASGTLEIGTAGMSSVLAIFSLTASAGAASNDVWTLALSCGTVTAGATGTAAAARIRGSGAADVITGLTVGTSGADVVLDSTSISSGQDVTISSATVTHA